MSGRIILRRFLGQGAAKAFSAERMWPFGVSSMTWPVAQTNGAAAVLRQFGIVCYEDDGASLVVQLLEENKYLKRGSCVEVSRGFVGEDDCRIVDQGPGYGHALHLSPDI